MLAAFSSRVVLAQDAADFDRAVTAARRNYSHAIRICVDTMLNVTEAEIRAHACWHREMTDLAAGKRDALDRCEITDHRNPTYIHLICTEHSEESQASLFCAEAWRSC